LEGDTRREGFVAVADDGGDSRKFCQFPGGALRVAAGGDDACLGIETMRAPDVGPSFTIGFGSDAASVHDDHMGFGGQRFGCSATSE